MNIRHVFMGIVIGIGAFSAAEAASPDTLETGAGPLLISLVGHGSVLFEFGGGVIHVDPFSRVGDYSSLPDADLILITHAHGDHLDIGAIEKIRKPDTKILLTETAYNRAGFGTVIKNGEEKEILGIRIQAVPAYNIKHMRDNGAPYHPKGEGNGYILTFGEKRIYVAGDTENTPEMKALQNIDVAFLPMNVPYTMTPEMVADAAKAFRPKILYPYHTGDAEKERLVRLIKNENNIEVRLR